MQVHIVADREEKIARLRALLRPAYRVTSALLSAQTSIPGECGAIIAAADLRLPDNIAALKEAAERFKTIRRRVFVIDQKARLLAEPRREGVRTRIGAGASRTQ